MNTPPFGGLEGYSIKMVGRETRARKMRIGKLKHLQRKEILSDL